MKRSREPRHERQHDTRPDCLKNGIRPAIASDSWYMGLNEDGEDVYYHEPTNTYAAVPHT